MRLTEASLAGFITGPQMGPLTTGDKCSSSVHRCPLMVVWMKTETRRRGEEVR